MVMDAKDIQSDLRALKRLYGLLRNDGDVTSNATSHLLDEHAQLLLKNLLDAATNRVLKVIAGEVEASGTLSPPLLQQPDESSEEQSAPQSRLSITAQGSQSCEKEIDPDKDTKMDGLDVILRKEKRFTPQWGHAGSMEQSVHTVPASGPQHGKKRCRICQRNTVKQLESIEETQLYDMARNSNSFTDLQHQQSNESDHYLWNSEQQFGLSLSNKSDESKSEKRRQRRPSVSNLDGIGDAEISSDRMVNDIAKVCNSDIGSTSKLKEVDCLSKEASKAIKQIELCISAFNIGADNLHLFEKNSAQPCNFVRETKSTGPAMQTKYGAVPSVGMSLGDETFMTRSNFLCGLSRHKIMDPVDYPMHQLSWVTAEEGNRPYMSLSETSKLVQPTRPLVRQSTNSIIRRGLALQSDVSGELGESIDESNFPTKKVNKIYGQNVKAIIDKIESGNLIMSRNGFVPSRTHNVKMFSQMALDPKDASYKTPGLPATFSSASKLESPYQSHMAMEDKRSRCRLFQTYKPSGSFVNLNNSESIQPVDTCLNCTSTLGTHGINHPPKIMGETLIYKKPSQLLVSSGFHENQSDVQHKDGTPRNRHYITAARTSLQQQESEGSCTDSYSNGRCEQTSSHYSDSEEYSLTDETRELQYVTSSRSSGSWGSPLSCGTGSQYSSYASNSEDDIYSSSFGDAACEVTSSGSSSKSKGYSSYEQPIRSYARHAYRSKQSTPRKSGPSRIHKAYGKNHEKQSGIWRRVKDRVAIIFHHHHHHHHHNDGDHANDQTKMGRNTSLKKRKGNVINIKRQDEAYGEKAVEKIRKSPIHEKEQQNHFRGLMEGLLRHVRHSKPVKGTASQLAKERHGKKKNLKKSHWWQLLQHHRGAKLPNAKLGLGKKKARLKALPKIK